MKLRPLGEQVVVQKIKPSPTTSGGIHVPDSAADKEDGAYEAVVLSVGSKVDEAVGLKAADVVLVAMYSGSRVNIGGEDIIIVSVDDIMAVVLEGKLR